VVLDHRLVAPPKEAPSRTWSGLIRAAWRCRCMAADVEQRVDVAAGAG
jgi:hypothetical protein